MTFYSRTLRLKEPLISHLDSREKSRKKRRKTKSCWKPLNHSFLNSEKHPEQKTGNCLKALCEILEKIKDDCDKKKTLNFVTLKENGDDFFVIFSVHIFVTPAAGKSKLKCVGAWKGSSKTCSREKTILDYILPHVLRDG